MLHILRMRAPTYILSIPYITTCVSCLSACVTNIFWLIYRTIIWLGLYVLYTTQTLNSIQKTLQSAFAHALSASVCRSEPHVIGRLFLGRCSTLPLHSTITWKHVQANYSTCNYIVIPRPLLHAPCPLLSEMIQNSSTTPTCSSRRRWREIG